MNIEVFIYASGISLEEINGLHASLYSIETPEKSQLYFVEILEIWLAYCKNYNGNWL